MAQKKTNAKATGRHKIKIDRYYSSHHALNKLRNILRRNGEAAAWEWAEAHVAYTTLRALLGRGRLTE